MRSSHVVPAALLLLTSASAHAALKLTYERKKTGDAASASTSTLTLDGERIRMEGVGGGRRGGGGRDGSGAMILDAAGKKILMIDPEKKVYREITEADAKEMKERMRGMRAQMAAQLKNLPPEQRKHAEQAMGPFGGGDGSPPEVKYEALGTKKKVAGFACEVYRVKVGDRPADESCFAPWSSNIVTKAEAAQFKKVASDIEKSFSFLPGMRFADWSHAPGIPIEQTHFGPDGKTAESVNTLKSVTRGAVPATEFQAPAGYTKESLPMGGGPRGMGGSGGPRGMGGPGGPPPGMPPKAP